MSIAYVLLQLFDTLGKRDIMRGSPSISSLFATSLINSSIHEHGCWILFITCYLIT